MAERSGDSRLMPIMAVLLLLILGEAGWLVYDQSFGTAGGAGGGDALTQIKAANVTARRALDGNVDAWNGLDGIAGNLQNIALERTPRAQCRFSSERRSPGRE